MNQDVPTFFRLSYFLTKLKTKEISYWPSLLSSSMFGSVRAGHECLLTWLPNALIQLQLQLRPPAGFCTLDITFSDFWPKADRSQLSFRTVSTAINFMLHRFSPMDITLAVGGNCSFILSVSRLNATQADDTRWLVLSSQCCIHCVEVLSSNSRLVCFYELWLLNTGHTWLAGQLNSSQNNAIIAKT